MAPKFEYVSGGCDECSKNTAEGNRDWKIDYARYVSLPRSGDSVLLAFQAENCPPKTWDALEEELVVTVQAAIAYIPGGRNAIDHFAFWEKDLVSGQWISFDDLLERPTAFAKPPPLKPSLVLCRWDSIYAEAVTPPLTSWQVGFGAVLSRHGQASQDPGVMMATRLSIAMSPPTMFTCEQFSLGKSFSAVLEGTFFSGFVESEFSLVTPVSKKRCQRHCASIETAPTAV